MQQIKDSLWEKETDSGRDQALFQPLQEDIFRQIDANEHHLAHFHFAIGPHRPQVAAHELVHALEDHLALGATHVQHPLVAQHLGAIDVDDGPQKVLQLGRIESPLGLEDKTLDIVIMMMVVAVPVAVFMGM